MRLSSRLRGLDGGRIRNGNKERSRGGFCVKSLPRAPSKTSLWLTCLRQTIRKRVGNSDTASKLAYHRSGSFSARFTRAITRCVIGLPAKLCGTARGGTPFFLREKRAGIRRSETAAATAQVNTAAVRTATPSGFAKQTEKDGEDQRIELNRIREILRLFQ